MTLRPLRSSASEMLAKPLSPELRELRSDFFFFLVFHLCSLNMSLFVSILGFFNYLFRILLGYRLVS